MGTQRVSSWEDGSLRGCGMCFCNWGCGVRRVLGDVWNCVEPYRGGDKCHPPVWSLFWLVPALLFWLLLPDVNDFWRQSVAREYSCR